MALIGGRLRLGNHKDLVRYLLKLDEEGNVITTQPRGKAISINETKLQYYRQLKNLLRNY